MNTPTLLLVLGAFVGLIGSSYFLLSGDSLFDKSLSASGEVAGRVIVVNGDLRRKTANQVKWDQLQSTETLYQNDSVYSGEKSKSEILVDDKKIVLGANTLIILSQTQRKNREINLAYGNFVAEVKKGESIEVVVGGERVKIDGSENAKVSVVQSKKKKPEVKVVSGQASVEPVKEVPQPVQPQEIVKSIEPEKVIEVSSKTQLIYPPPEQVFPSQEGEAEITLVGQPLENHVLELQLVREGEDFDGFSSEKLRGDRVTKRLSPGQYRWRMRAQLSGRDPSPWTEEARFSVRPSYLTLPTFNDLPQQVGLHHTQRLQNFFASAELPQGSWLEVSELRSQKIFKVDSRSWPEELNQPGVIQYSYRLRKSGYFSSPWSKPKLLQLYLPPPENLRVETPEVINPNEKNKVTIKLSWEDYFIESKSEIQISRDKEFRKKTSLYTTRSSKYLGVDVNTDYYIRVRNTGESRRALSVFSKAIQLNVPYAKPEPVLDLALSSKLVPEVKAKPKRVPAATPESSSRESVLEEKMKVSRSQLWAWVGTGVNFVDYEQVVDQRADFDFSSNQFANYYLNVGWMSPKWGADASYKTTPGKVNDTGNFVDNKDFKWTTLTLDGLYVLPWAPTVGGSSIKTYLRGGVQKHNIPQLYLTSNDELSLVENDLLSGALGMGGEITRGSWQYSAFMRYQHPISSQVASASSFSINPKLAFDGSLGVSYAFAQRFSMGVFWYGHWINYDYEYVDNSSTQTGFQSLFFSNMDIRFGFQF